MDISKVNTAVEKLSEVLKGMRKCLECAICYDTLSVPVRAQCGHSFCRTCIVTLLNQRNGPCPLCKVNLTRRSFSDDKHTELCIEKTDHLALAISKDTGFSEFGQFIKPKLTTEGHPTLDSYIRRSSQSSIPGTSKNNNMQNKPKSVKPTGKRKGRSSKKLMKTVQPSVCNNRSSTSSRLSGISKGIDIVICNKENTDTEDTASRVEAWLDDLNYARNLNTSSKPSLNMPQSSKLDTSSDSQIMLNTSDTEIEGQLNPPQIFHSGSKKDTLAPQTFKKANVVNSHKERDCKPIEESRVDYKKVDTTNTSKMNQVIHATNHQQKNTNKTKQQALSKSSENLMEPANTSFNLTKDTWSSVKTFGKDMRSKKKKLKSLNVSRESTGYLKTPGSIKHEKVLDTMQRIEMDNLAISELENSILKGRNINSKVNEDSTSVTTGETVIQTDCPLNNQMNQPHKNILIKPCENSILHENEISISTVTDASSEPDKTKDTSFIMMGGGKLVHIQNLDDYQMKDIIGVTSGSIENANLIKKKDDSGKDDKSEGLVLISQKSLQNKDNEVSQGNQVDRAVLSLKRRSDSSNPASSNSVVSSPIGSIASIRSEKIREVLSRSFSGSQKSAQAPQARYTIDSPIMMNTPLNASGKLSLKKNSSSSHEKSASPTPRTLSLPSTARRNLTTAMSNTSFADIGNPTKIKYNKIGAEDKPSRNSTNDENTTGISEIRRDDKGEKTTKVTSMNKNIRDDKMCPNIGNKCNVRTTQSNDAKSLNRRSFVMFKKLGRVMKYRHTTSKFFYANRLSRERPLRTLSRLEQMQVYYQNVPSPNDNDIIWLPGTPVIPDKTPAVVFTTANEPRRNIFSSKNTSTESGICDETTFLRRVEQENTEPVDVKETTVVRNEFETQGSVDVIFVSLDKNERTAQSPEALQARDAILNCNADINTEGKEISNDTDCKGVKAKILSPGKDSQLMFLSMDSPVSERPQFKIKPLATISEISKVAPAVASGSGFKSFSEVKGTNSQALIRRSQESNKNGSIEKNSALSGEMPMQVTVISSDTNQAPIADRKRKRIDQEQLHQTKKRNTIHSSSSESQVQYKDSSKLFDKKVMSLPKCRGSINDIVELSLESDLSETADKYDLDERVNVPKKKYKRIIRANSSDTDSNDEMFFAPNKTDTRLNKGRFSDKQKFNKNEKNTSSLLQSTSQVSSKVTEPSSTNRKHVDTKDSSSDDEDVNAIVKEWCNEVLTPQKFTRKSNESMKDTSIYKKSLNTSLTNQSTALTIIEKNARKSLEHSFKESGSMDFNCTGSAKVPSKESLERVTVEKEPTDIRDQVINDIIGRVRKIQKADSDSSQCKDSQNNSMNVTLASDRNPEVILRENLMEDNFDEAIANVDTQALTNTYLDTNVVVTKKDNTMRTTEKITSIESPGNLITNELPTSINKSSRKFVSPCKTSSETPIACSSSDKENDNYLVRRQKNSLNAENVIQNLQKREESQTERKNACVAPSHTIAHERNVNTEIIAMELNLSGDGNGESSQKDSLFEHDTLMNVTQYSKMLKQLEDDFLGPVKPTTLTNKQNEGETNQLRKAEDSPRTPKRTDEQMRNKDTDQSGEDDIVESTPEVRTKSTLRGSSSSLTRNRETSVSSPLSGTTSIKDSEYSPLRGFLRTPQVQKGIFPRYQSTPKVPADVAANDDPISAGKLVFVCSKLTPQEIERVKEFAQMYNGTYNNQFTLDVTHVIVKMDKENNATDRTLKYLQGIAHRKWIVGYDWVVKSIAQRCPVNEEPYEAVDNGSLEAGPRNSRLRKNGIFEGFVFLCVGSYTHMSIDQCQDLLRATGATIVETPEELAAVKNRLKPIALFSDSDCDAPVDWYHELKIATVSESWIVDCISQFKLVAFAPYLINIGASQLSSTYPEELLVEENESDVDDDFDNDTLQ